VTVLRSAPSQKQDYDGPEGLGASTFGSPLRSTYLDKSSGGQGRIEHPIIVEKSRDWLQAVLQAEHALNSLKTS
jgi:hypothetical protein